MTTYTLNQEHNGIEINFTEKPTDAVRGTLKTFGFRWRATKKVWYAKNTKERLEFAKNMLKQDEHDTALKASEAKAEKANKAKAEKANKTKADKASEAKAEAKSMDTRLEEAFKTLEEAFGSKEAFAKWVVDTAKADAKAKSKKK